MQASLIFATPNAEALIERAGRVCYRSHNKTTETSAIPFIRGILARGHESVIEHSNFVFEVQAFEMHVMNLMLANPLIRVSRRPDKDFSRDSYLISGNARMFRDAQVFEYFPDAWIQLLERNPALFVNNPQVQIAQEVEPHSVIASTANVDLWNIDKPEGLTPDEMRKHCTATVYLHGVSRALTHQLVRHRMASYSQASQRYCYEGKTDAYIPESLRDRSTPGYKLFMHVFGQSDVGYRSMVKSFGIPKEDARYILPAAMHTEIVVTMHLDDWEHFFALRCDKHAQAEIREVAMQIRSLLAERVPEVIG